VSLWRRLTRGIADLRDRTRRDRDTADEVAHYLEQLAQEGIQRGLAPEQARRAARLALGGETQVREQVGRYGWERGVASFLEDLRYAWRGLRGDPGFSVVAIVTLAVGIGGATAIFSAVHPILFASLPYPDGDRVRAIVETHPDGSRGAATFGMYRGLSEGARSFGALSVFRPWRPTLTGPDHPERLEGQRVSAGYFRVLGVPPSRGRDFTEADDRAGSANVAIVSDALWRARFGADPAVIGRQVTLDDAGFTVIGVMPAGFENLPAAAAVVWTPLKYAITDGRAWGRHLTLVGRLGAGIETDAAVAELNAVGQRVVREQRPPTYDARVAWSAPSLQEELTRDVRPALLAVFAAVGLVLSLACVNVTNMLLARGVRRRAEFALRAALGAARGRLTRQLLTESLLLSGIGGGLGVIVAALSVRGAAALTPAGLPRSEAVGVDGSVLLFALAITTLAGVTFGIVPAAQATGRDRLAIDRGSARIAGGGPRRVRGALVVVQVALALVLLVGSGLLLRSMRRLFAVSPGFVATDLMTMQIQASPLRFAEAGATARFFDEALEAVRRVPGVAAAALTSQLPLSGDRDAYGVHLERPPAQRPDDDREIFRYAVSPAYPAVMGIPLRAGRMLAADDRGDAPPVVLVNESFARRYFPGVDPIGRRLRIGPVDGPLYSVVGVVGDVKQLSLAGGVPDAVYTTTSQWRFEDNVMSLVVRGRTDVASLVPAIRAAVWSVDRDQPVVRVAAMEDLLDASAAERRFVLVLFQLFGAAALVLTAAGIYGMMSGSVAERTREIGLRSAVGASRAQVVGFVLRQGARLTLLGIAIGVGGAVAGSRLLEAMLYDVSRLDLATYAGVAALLAVVSLIACATPAWRAARIDPARTLRV